MSDEHDYKKLIKKIKSLPNIKDSTHKETLYHNISTKMKEQEAHKNDRIHSRQLRHQRRKKRIIPIFSTALVIAILFIMLPSVFNLDESIKEQTSINRFNSNKNSVKDNNNNLDIEKKQTDKERHDSNEINSTSNEEGETTKSDYQSFTITADLNSDIVYGAVTDLELQYFIPVSTTIPKSENIEVHYNELGEVITSEAWGVSEYLFNDAIFDIDFENKVVTMELTDQFSLEEGSAKAHSFEKILAHMFLPYDIDTVNFTKKIDLGSHIGVVSEINLVRQLDSYKVFQADEDKRKFLIPIPAEHSDISITQSFDEMKNSEKEFNVYSTIPSQVNYSIEEDDTNLIVTFTDDSDLVDNQKMMTMIEAMLMTAKSYGFETITFNANITQIGPYKMNEVIEVPDAVNPLGIN